MKLKFLDFECVESCAECDFMKVINFHLTKCFKIREAMFTSLRQARYFICERWVKREK